MMTLYHDALNLSSARCSLLFEPAKWTICCSTVDCLRLKREPLAIVFFHVDHS
jgi:hypothetical protein